MRAMIDQFLDYLSLERGLSPNTRSAYSHDLGTFASWLQARQVGSWNAVTRRHVLDFLLEQREAGHKTTSISRRLVAIKVFFRYLVQENLLASNVTDAMDSPRLWSVLPDVLSMKEVDRLLEAPDIKKPSGLRDRAMLEMLYGTGLRVSELVSLKTEDVRFDENYVRCMGKGRKERLVPFGKSVRDWVERYLAQSRPRLDRSGGAPCLFVSSRGGPLNRRTVWRMIGTWARRAGITKHVHPHTLRHSFASHLLANNAPIRVIQEMLGHADIATTQIYMHVDSGRLRSVHEKFHPRA